MQFKVFSVLQVNRLKVTIMGSHNSCWHVYSVQYNARYTWQTICREQKIWDAFNHGI